MINGLRGLSHNIRLIASSTRTTVRPTGDLDGDLGRALSRQGR